MRNFLRRNRLPLVLLVVWCGGILAYRIATRPTPPPPLTAEQRARIDQLRADFHRRQAERLRELQQYAD